MILLSIGLLLVILLLSTTIWYWCHRVRRRLRRHHSIPIVINERIHQNEIIDKHLSAPPVPPRPTAYTNLLGKVEYRSNL